MDPIADMLTTIRNAMQVRKFAITVPYSKLKERIGSMFQELGFIADMKADPETRTLAFRIVEENNIARFHTINRLSTPGRRLYVGWKEIPRPSGNGVILISTSQGIMTGRTAKHRKLGGELICEIY